MNSPKTVYVGTDHAGYEMKEQFKKHLTEKAIKFVDLGCFSMDAVDYPDIAREVCEKVNEDQNSYGVLFCGSGIGMSITANKMQGIRASLCTSEEMAKLARQHNKANVLCIGSRLTPLDLALKMFDIFYVTEFEPAERYVRRVDKIMALDKNMKGATIQDRC